MRLLCRYTPRNDKLRMNICSIVFCMFVLTGLSLAQKIDIELSNPMEIGKEDLLFGSIAAVCEDKEGNFYVVDQIEAKVFKFTTEGKLLTSFGQKGQGPGDFQRPNRISYTTKGNLAVADEMYYVSFLNTDGKFLRRVHLNEALTPGYVGEDRFYAWRWQPEGRQQILLDSEGSLVKTFHTAQRDQFSISIPDETGRKVMFNFNQPAYAPAEGSLQLHFAKWGNSIPEIVATLLASPSMLLEHFTEPRRLL